MMRFTGIKSNAGCKVSVEKEGDGLAGFRPECHDYGMSTLPPELRKAIKAAGNQPVMVLDPETNRQYVLLRADLYERLHLLFDYGPPSRQEQEALLRQAGKRTGWDDPEMDIYNELDPHS